MKHIPYENWLKYVEDNLENEELRSRYEDHLYSCDQCLELYLQAMEATSGNWPTLEGTDFTEHVMQEVKPPEKAKNPVKRNNRRRQTLIHYTLAAAMTLFLTSTGIFSHLAMVTTSFESQPKTEKTSFVSKILNKQVSITERFEQQEHKEGFKHE